jgi:hypothetical protein
MEYRLHSEYNVVQRMKLSSTQTKLSKCKEADDAQLKHGI